MGLEATYQALTTANQARLFQNILNQMQPFGDESNTQEINSLMEEIQRLQNPQTAALEAGSPILDGSPAGSNSGAGENPLATALLLSLSAVSGNPEGMGRLYSVNMGTHTTRSAVANSVPSASRSENVPRSSGDVGSLAARFESGKDGVGAIGYDERGGTSYGIYQIASRVGTMRQFLDYLDARDPKLAARLKAAGPADTGGRGGEMPAVWKQIAGENPERFAMLQHDFIEETHYTPALQEIYQRSGLNVENQGRAMKEVLWSTAVQHGPRGAANIFCNAIEQPTESAGAIRPGDMIESIYSARAKQFGGSSSGIRASVQGRFRQEKSMALAMLGQQETGANAAV
jgi:hypothetical protein